MFISFSEASGGRVETLAGSDIVISCNYVTQKLFTTVLWLLILKVNLNHIFSFLEIFLPLVLNFQIIPVCSIMDYYMFPFALVKLGGLQAIAELLQVDCEMHGLTNDHYSVTLRRYAGMALTNLTFGDVANKVCLL